MTYEFHWDRMTFYETMDQGFYLPLLLVFIVAQLVARVIFRAFALQFLIPKYVPESKRVGIANSIWYTLGIVISFIYGETFAWETSWRWKDYGDCFRGLPHQMIEPALKLYYTYSLAFYIYGLIVLCLDEKMKDFVAMFVHHIATISLIVLSGSSNLHRIGALIMLTFDICDIFLETAKLANKLKFDMASVPPFLLFVIAWVVNRLYLYPFWVLPTIADGHNLSGHPVPYHNTLLFLLYLIQILQVYWSFFIAKKLYSIIVHGPSRGDPREEDILKAKKAQ